MMKFDRDGQLEALATVCDETVPTVSELVAQFGLAPTLGTPERAHEAAQRAMAAAARAEREIATPRQRIVCLECLVSTDELTSVVHWHDRVIRVGGSLHRGGTLSPICLAETRAP